MGSVLRVIVRAVVLVVAQLLVDQLHSALDIERSAHTAQCETELNEGDRHGRLHADDNGLSVENLRYARDVAEHPADEAVDDLERRNVDQDPAGARGYDLLGEILLERHRQAVVHIDLDRDEEGPSELEDWNAV